MRFPTLGGLGILCAAILGAEARPASAQKPESSYVVHPLCVQKVVRMMDFRFQSGEDQLDVAKCNRTFRRSKVNASSADWLFADEPSSEAPRPYFGYRVVGPLNAKVFLVEVSESGGGTGIFSALAFISGWPKAKSSRDARLTTVGIVEGGDRCQGTLTGTKIMSPPMVRISWTVTPASFFSPGPDFSIRATADGRYEVATLRDADRVSRLPMGEGLSNFPQDCIGKATIEFDLASGAAQLAGVAVDTTDLPTKGQYQQCFNRLIREVGIGPSVSFSAEQHLAFAHRYERECTRS